MNSIEHSLYDIQWFVNIYNDCLAEDDIKLILDLLPAGKLRILEPLCGNGRILAPLAKAGHYMTGIDRSELMLKSLEEKSGHLANIKWYQGDISTIDWGEGYDVVIFAVNAFNEFSSAEIQRFCIKKAYGALKPGGFLYIDNKKYDQPETVLLPGETHVVIDKYDVEGTHGKYLYTIVSYDVDSHIYITNCCCQLTYRDGTRWNREFLKTKHLPSIQQMETWIDAEGFSIKDCFGDYHKGPVSKESKKVIYWLKKK